MAFSLLFGAHYVKEKYVCALRGLQEWFEVV